MQNFKSPNFTGLTKSFLSRACSLTAVVSALLIATLSTGCKEAKYTLTLTANPSDAGTFLTSPEVTGSIAEGTKITVIPKPVVNYYFSKWTGDKEDNTEILELVMDGDKNIVAEFLPGVNETFQDGNADYFTEDAPGHWEVNDTAYIMTGSLSNTWLYSVYNYNAYDNFEASVDITFVYEPDGFNNPAGIYFRSEAANPETNSYWVIISPKGQWYLLKENNGAYTYIKSWTSSSDLNAGLGIRNNLKVVCNGNTIEVFLNGVSQGSFTDDTFSSGHIGLFGYDTNANSNIYCFDNFAVRPISAGTKSITTAGTQTPDTNQDCDPRFN